MGLKIGDFGLRLGIEDGLVKWDRDLELGIGIHNLYLQWRLGIGIGTYDWRLGLRFGIGIGIISGIGDWALGLGNRDCD